MEDLKLTQLELDEIEDSLKNKYLTFDIENESFGIPIKFVNQIIGIQTISPMPDTPEFVKGVVNLRGNVIPVIDARLRFGLPIADYNDRTCIIILIIHEELFGLIVDKVSEVALIMQENISPPLNKKLTKGNKYIAGIGKVGDSVKILIEPSELISEAEFNILRDK
jgi:purine-binding chemotaxis protein CheW